MAARRHRSPEWGCIRRKTPDDVGCGQPGDGLQPGPGPRPQGLGPGPGGGGHGALPGGAVVQGRCDAVSSLATAIVLHWRRPRVEEYAWIRHLPVGRRDCLRGRREIRSARIWGIRRRGRGRGPLRSPLRSREAVPSLTGRGPGAIAPSSSCCGRMSRCWRASGSFAASILAMSSPRRRSSPLPRTPQADHACRVRCGWGRPASASPPPRQSWCTSRAATWRCTSTSSSRSEERRVGKECRL